MNCYHCGCRLSEKDFCTGCGADVSRYKQIMFASNRYYNDGLEKAQIRDLSGAIISLKQSLKLNKNHIEARNLLGLIYFEMGETVAALSEWVISRSLKSDKNIAEDYINMIQNNPTRLETINQTIKKFNLALNYCNQGSLDLASIQLKKVVSLNLKYIQAHQLLALLYMNSEEWDKARKELEVCKRIDVGNVTTNRYLKEVEESQGFEESKNPGKRKKTVETAIREQNGNEVVIKPNSPKESSGLTVIINIAIGLLIGLAIGWFLILPSRVKDAKEEVNVELRDMGNQLDVKNATIDELNQRVEDLMKDNGTLSDEIEGYEGTEGTLQAHKDLMMAATEYLAEKPDYLTVAEYLEQIDESFLDGQASDSFVELYQLLYASIGKDVSSSHYDAGYAASKLEDYATAIKELSKAVHYDAENGEALYLLATSYKASGNLIKAKETFEKVIELFPGSEKAVKAQNGLNEIKED